VPPLVRGGIMLRSFPAGLAGALAGVIFGMIDLLIRITCFAFYIWFFKPGDWRDPAEKA
jgi:hypothetical protein